VLAQYPSSDSSAEKNAAPEGEGQRTTTSQWQNAQLVAVTQSPRGKSTRTYSLSPDGKQLYVTTKMENERLKEPVHIASSTMLLVVARRINISRTLSIARLKR
jgi:hypothetical protein